MGGTWWGQASIVLKSLVAPPIGPAGGEVASKAAPALATAPAGVERGGGGGDAGGVAGALGCLATGAGEGEWKEVGEGGAWGAPVFCLRLSSRS